MARPSNDATTRDHTSWRMKLDCVSWTRSMPSDKSESERGTVVRHGSNTMAAAYDGKMPGTVRMYTTPVTAKTESDRGWLAQWRYTMARSKPRTCTAMASRSSRITTSVCWKFSSLVLVLAGEGRASMFVFLRWDPSRTKLTSFLIRVSSNPDRRRWRT